MRVCVLGHSGLLGSAFRAVMIKHGEFADILTGNPSRRIINSDMSSTQIIDKILGYRPDVIINCISNTNIEFCENNYDTALQTESKLVVASLAAARLNGSIYVYISSDYVFSGQEEYYTTECATDPINGYGKIKSICEEIVLKYEKAFVMRPSIIYGRNFYTQKYSAFLRDVLGAARPENILAIKYPIWSVDLAEAILKTISSTNEFGCFHFSTISGKHRGDWFDCLAKYSRVNVSVDVDNVFKHQIAEKPINVRLVPKHRNGIIRDIEQMMEENNGNFDIRK